MDVGAFRRKHKRGSKLLFCPVEFALRQVQLGEFQSRVHELRLPLHKFCDLLITSGVIPFAEAIERRLELRCVPLTLKCRHNLFLALLAAWWLLGQVAFQRRQGGASGGHGETDQQQCQRRRLVAISMHRMDEDELE